MTKKGPVLLFGPPIHYQPWIQWDMTVIRDWLQDRHGLKGIIHIPTDVIGTGYPGYGYLLMGGA